MAFFLPSYIQKRLLRYALSRLEFVDTDDLNLDKLGVTLGQRSVIELKDVGLRIEVRPPYVLSRGGAIV
jgi:autophagy-related protein 2